MRELFNAAIFTIVISAAGSALEAQTCTGLASLAGATTQVSAGVAGYTYATAVHASASASRSASFGSLTIARVHDGDLARSSYGLDIQYGREVRGRAWLFLCPLADVGVSFVPRDPILSTGPAQRLSGAAGAAVAADARVTSGLSMHPVGSLRLVGLLVRRPHSDGSHVYRDVHVLLGGGLGIVLFDRVTVRPGFTVPVGLPPVESSTSALAVPFGREEREISIDLSVAVVIGKRSAVRR